MACCIAPDHEHTFMHTVLIGACACLCATRRAGVTGVRVAMESRVEGLIKQLQAVTDKPVCVGFGVSGPEQAALIRQWGAEGVICGSALVRALGEAPTPGERAQWACVCVCVVVCVGVYGNVWPCKAGVCMLLSSHSDYVPLTGWLRVHVMFCRGGPAANGGAGDVSAGSHLTARLQHPWLAVSATLLPCKT